MLGLIAAIAITNLGLGYALAIYLGRRGVGPSAGLGASRGTLRGATKSAATAAGDEESISDGRDARESASKEPPSADVVVPPGGAVRTSPLNKIDRREDDIALNASNKVGETAKSAPLAPAPTAASDPAATAIGTKKPNPQGTSVDNAEPQSAAASPAPDPARVGAASESVAAVAEPSQELGQEPGQAAAVAASSTQDSAAPPEQTTSPAHEPPIATSRVIVRPNAHSHETVLPAAKSEKVSSTELSAAAVSAAAVSAAADATAEESRMAEHAPQQTPDAALPVDMEALIAQMTSNLASLDETDGGDHSDDDAIALAPEKKPSTNEASIVDENATAGAEVANDNVEPETHAKVDEDMLAGIEAFRAQLAQMKDQVEAT